MDQQASIVEHFTPSLDPASTEAPSTLSLIWCSTILTTIQSWLLISLSLVESKEEFSSVDGVLELLERVWSVHSNTLKSAGRPVNRGNLLRLTRASVLCSPEPKAC
jgi:hypothetical protein